VPLRAQSVSRRTIETIDGASVVAAILIIAAVGAVRARFARAVGAAFVVVLSVGSAELLKRGLPHIPHAVPAGRMSSLPSGHTAVAASVGLGLVIALPPVLRPLAVLAGSAYASAIAFSLVVLDFHYPSDVVASFFLCGFWASVVVVAIGGTRRRAVTPGGIALAALTTAVALAVAAAIASRHPVVAAARSREAMLAAAVCLGALSLGVFTLVASLAGEEHR
jgi:membrane-associated phospholipid phosphatase